jgi:hypothetical protein
MKEASPEIIGVNGGPWGAADVLTEISKVSMERL